jgi:pimeloyl-ACP methyl ester carboxylesterase
MSKVVLVHGAFNELWGPNELKARWLPALRDGLWHHGVAIDESDVAVCFYGDLFRRDPLAADATTFAASRAGVAEMLQKLGDGASLDAVSQAASVAAFDRTVDMVTTMTTVPDLWDQIHARIDQVVTEDTQVIVGHSMGSVISYSALRRNQDWNVHTLVTLGSPLGQRMIIDLLNPPFVEGDAWPGQVSRWVNVAAVGDQAAKVHCLADIYDPRVEDRRVDNGHRYHDPEPYLNSAPTGEAVAAALAT